jgi:hypothetical protein
VKAYSTWILAMRKHLLLALEIYKGLQCFFNKKNLFGIFMHIIDKGFQSHSVLVTSPHIIQEMSNDISTGIVGSYNDYFSILCAANTNA